ncbi:MAG: C40 family peptidase [Chloroflexi bacterium]|nr:C40 family peptidase [Chloroflexota bacterium]
MSIPTRWLANHAVTELWSSPMDDAVAFTLVPQWSIFQQIGEQQGHRIQVHYFGNRASEEGDVWVDAEDLGPIPRPEGVVEPEWPDSPEPEAVEPSGTFRPATAPPISSSHVVLIAAAARVAEIDAAVLAATAARQSGFRVDALHAEPGLGFVRWREAPGEPFSRYSEAAVGVCQILRSTLLTFGIDNDQEAMDPARSYRVAALIIRQNLAAFPGDHRAAIAAYIVGQYGAQIGRGPAVDFVDAVLTWAGEYRPLFGSRSAGAAAETEPGDSSALGGMPLGDLAGRPPSVLAGPGGSPAMAGMTLSTPPRGQPSSGPLGEGLVDYARTLLGTPYVFGGKRVQRDAGLDSSGFVCEVLEQCGLRLGNRDYLSAEAIRQRTRQIGETEAQIGDLVFFQGTYHTPGASHLGFWLGGGKMLDTHQPGGVQVTSIDAPYWREHFLCLGRLPELEQDGAGVIWVNQPGQASGSVATERTDPGLCSFCGRLPQQVSRLIAGPLGSGVAICEHCVQAFARESGPTGRLLGDWGAAGPTAPPDRPAGK